MWLENPGPAGFEDERKAHCIKCPDVPFKTIPYKGGMAVFCTEFFRTKAPHDDPRISVRLLKELEWHSFNGDGSKDILRSVLVSRMSGMPIASSAPM